MEGWRPNPAIVQLESLGEAVSRRGGVLFEVVLAIALFVSAGAFALGSVKTVFAALDRTRREQELIDLARSRMAELEAGMISLSDLRGEADGVRSDPSASANDRINDLARGASESERWTIDVQTSRTEFTGLSLVEVTVNETDTSVPEAERMAYTLRQLLPLGGE